MVAVDSLEEETKENSGEAKRNKREKLTKEEETRGCREERDNCLKNAF